MRAGPAVRYNGRLGIESTIYVARIGERRKDATAGYRWFSFVMTSGVDYYSIIRPGDRKQNYLSRREESPAKKEKREREVSGTQSRGLGQLM